MKKRRIIPVFCLATLLWSCSKTEFSANRESFMYPLSEDIEIDANQNFNIGQIETKTETYIEAMSMETEFILNSDSLTISTGKSFNFLKISGKNFFIYGHNWPYQNSILKATLALPFEIKKNSKIVMGWKKSSDDISFYISVDKQYFTKSISKTEDELTAMMWGTPFLRVEQGNIKVLKSTLSSPYFNPAKVLIIGDSFIEGSSILKYGLEKRYAAQIARNIGIKDVVLDGKGGEAVNDQLVNRFVQEIKWCKPTYAILALGTNGMSNSDLEKYKKGIRAMIDSCHSYNVIPILVTVTPRPGADFITITDAKNKFVKEQNELCIDFYSAIVDKEDPNKWADGLVQQDGVHPTVKGHQIMFEQAKKDLPFLLK